jgi:hypothetical protein
MAFTITGFTNGVAGQGLKPAGGFQQNSLAGGRSFESVLRGGDVPAGQTPQAPSGAQAPEAAAQLPLRTETLDVNVRQELTRLVLNEESRTRGGGLFGFVSQIEKANLRSDAVLKELASNKDLSQGDLLVMQTMVYKAAQSTEVLSKVVDQVTGSVKTILSTNV